MKLIYSLVVALIFTFAGFAQNGLYVKYKTDINGVGEESEMMVMMMKGSTMEIATSEKITWVKTQMGNITTMAMKMDTEQEQITILMSGLMGTMAFQGPPDDLVDKEEEEPKVDIKLVDQAKEISGHTCKKAIITDNDGNKTVYWYSEEFKLPEGMKQMPNQVPELCLQMEIPPQEGLIMKYTVIEIKEDVDMGDFKLIIPEGTEIMGLEEMKNMGMGGM